MNLWGRVDNYEGGGWMRVQQKFLCLLFLLLAYDSFSETP